MTTEEFNIELFFRIDEDLSDVQKHSQAQLYPSEVITLAFLFALKALAIAPFIAGWRDWKHLFPNLPERRACFVFFACTAI